MPPKRRTPTGGCFPCRINRRLCPMAAQDGGSCSNCLVQGWKCQGYGKRVPGWTKNQAFITWVRTALMNQIDPPPARTRTSGMVAGTGASHTSFLDPESVSSLQPLRSALPPGPSENDSRTAFTPGVVQFFGQPDSPIATCSVTHSVLGPNPGSIASYSNFEASSIPDVPRINEGSSGHHHQVTSVSNPPLSFLPVGRAPGDALLYSPQPAGVPLAHNQDFFRPLTTPSSSWQGSFPIAR
ncbi:uncharacterized protein EI90DRAFT_1680339 [Cantharellus anzutake]|uniref:uncharacterized protein n=1 Tax=Cantharellus anzutake TaxID=1750568 RepID=UPI0019058058|nr:uncharacterized protein EI90DRAFT_1680339 [Cantharellus anzutake]KAF8327754.1 hypothetical protein EI90DRAFT_1680339 [Cantharellus anzutake]